MAGSFYGGKAGAPFIIVCTYNSVDAMAKAFANGSQYTTVQFDEYVLINTVNKNDPDNGRVYRRGYQLDLLEDNPRKNDTSQPAKRQTGGGIYVGSIVGPSGHAPQFNLTTMSGVTSESNNWDEQTWDVRKGSGSYTVTNNGLCPGKYVIESTGETLFNDAIQWNYVSIRDTNNEDTNAYVGFKFPYTVVDYEAELVDTYTNDNLVSRVDDKSHPFYEKWKIKIPKGVTGDTLKNLRIISTKSEFNKVKSYNGKTEDLSGINNDSSSPRQILVYDHYNYDESRNSTPTTIYLGDYNMISNISLDNNGTFKVNYTHQNSSTWDKKISWIKSVSVNETNGTLKVLYNNNTITGTGITTEDNCSCYTAKLNWIKSAAVQEDGSLKLTYVDGTTTSTSENLIKWINDISFNTNGTLTVTYNTKKSGTDEFEKSEFTNALTTIKSASLTDKGNFSMTFNNNSINAINTTIKWIKDVTIGDDGKLKISFNNSDDSVANSFITKQLKWIKELNLSNDGTLDFTFCDNSTNSFPKKIKWIDDIKINEEDQKINIRYNTSEDEEYESIGNPINYIDKVAVRPEDAMLLVLYSDPERQNKNITYNGITGWVELTSVRDYSGLLNGLVLDSSKVIGISTDSGAKEYLDSHYPRGLVGINVAGKTVSIIRPGMRTVIYAFDYNDDSNKWQKLGYIESSAPQFVCAKDTPSETLDEQKEQLVVGGIWFVEEDD